MGAACEGSERTEPPPPAAPGRPCLPLPARVRGGRAAGARWLPGSRLPALAREAGGAAGIHPKWRWEAQL